MVERRINQCTNSQRQIQIKKYYKQGKTWTEIKNLTGCSNYSISKILTPFKIIKGEVNMSLQIVKEGGSTQYESYENQINKINNKNVTIDIKKDIDYFQNVITKYSK